MAGFFHYFCQVMKQYIETRIKLTPWDADMADYLAALLGDIGYDTFQQQPPCLTAWSNTLTSQPETLATLLDEFAATGIQTMAETSLLQGRDWNAEWVRNYFRPIVIAGRCVVCSSFHSDIPDAPIRITVDPKMAFGTGHHATTRLMLTYLLDNPPAGLAVTDMGTGTGILAILAAILGAASVAGVEIDPDAYANACENARLNNASLNLLCGDASLLPRLPEADLFLANINRNIIIGDLAAYRSAMRPGARLVCSGFYTDDIPVLAEAASRHGLTLLSTAEEERWARVEFRADPLP